ncbi:hypothetical protein SKAU_G00264260 [Synaphobranchus kaupii]|uniref:Uncharacterized protein n=1 Tax=Synaphobranchus kaupii TaxID=118154 RepID=A0A9Q1IPQ4_SYNKA|nr:hypothetical protein SKAU_G00264260 [Synaphobranchus kaupii]
MNQQGDHEEGMSAFEMETAPERNIFLLHGETSQGTLGYKRPQDDGPPSPAPSYESMKSDVSFDDASFDLSDGSEELLPNLSHPRIQLERSDSPVSSCCSMESDVSMECPVKPFWMGPRPQVQKPGVSKRSTRWVPLDRAEGKGPARYH